VGELVRDRQTPVAGEIGLVVRDDEQRQGIGSVLLWQLVRAAQRRGVTRLHANLLAENRVMRHMLQGLGLPYTATISHGEIDANVDLVRSNFYVGSARPLAFSGDLAPAASVVDMLKYYARLLEDFTMRGGQVVIGALHAGDVERLAG